MCMLCTCLLLVTLTIAGVVLYFVFFRKNQEDLAEEDPLKYFWNAGGNGTSESTHPFQEHLSQDLVVNGTCYKVFRRNMGWDMILHLCSPKNVYGGQNQTEPEKTNLYFVPQKYFGIFSGDNRTLWHSVEENGICYSFESIGRTNGSFTFLPADCALYAPSICSGQQNVTCT